MMSIAFLPFGSFFGTACVSSQKIHNNVIKRARDTTDDDGVVSSVAAKIFPSICLLSFHGGGGFSD